MQFKIEQSSVAITLKQFISLPNFLSASNFIFALKKNMNDFDRNKDWIIEYLRQCNNTGNKVPMDIVHIIFMLLAAANLSVSKDVTHNVLQIMTRLENFDPEHCQYADMLWNLMAIGVLTSVHYSLTIKLSAPWQALIPNHDNLNKQQIGGYCIGKALAINPNNTDAWLHLAIVFNTTSLALSDLPKELITLFKQSYQEIPNPLQCALFCCNQVLSNKYNNEIFNLAIRLKTMVTSKLNPSRPQLTPLSRVLESRISPFLSPGYHKQSTIVTTSMKVGPGVQPLVKATKSMVIPAPNLIQPSKVTENAILPQTIPAASTPDNKEDQAILEKLTNRISTFDYRKNVRSLFNDDLTIADVKRAINNADCLIKILNTFTQSSVRHNFIYALFTAPIHWEHHQRNSANSQRDEEFIMKIIKSKQDFEKILAVIPEDTRTFHARSTTENKYKKSPYVASLYKAQIVPDNRPQAINNPAHVPVTFFASRVIPNRQPFNIPPVRPVRNGLEVTFIDLTEKQTPDANEEVMTIETVPATIVKRERDTDSDEVSFLDEPLQKRPRI